MGMRTRFAAGMAAALGFLMGFVVTAAAGQATSDYGYYTVNTVDYRTQAAINTSTSSHLAYTVILVSPRNKAAPSGWIGASPRLYRGNGNLVCTADYKYNPSSVAQNAVFNPSGCSRYESGTWYSRGATRGWNGSSYQSFWTFFSPHQNS